MWIVFLVPPLPGQPIAPPRTQTGPTGPGVTRTPGDTTAPLPDPTPTPGQGNIVIGPGPGIAGIRPTPDPTTPIPDPAPEPTTDPDIVPGIPEPNICDTQPNLPVYTKYSNGTRTG
jgi:hypothetical protein